jgi:outer membrane protein OmpA-like peptidoglycan-associated protein
MSHHFFSGLVLSLATAASAWAQQPTAANSAPMAEATVQSLVAALSAEPLTRSFRRTQLPDTSSSLCADAPPAANKPGVLTRTLEVVPYAGDSTPGVNLSVQFATGSDRLTAADKALLNQLAGALKTPELAQDKFAVAGHTDSTGDARVNLELSCARALAVRGYLASQGVQAQRLSAYGFGQTRLLDGNNPSSGTNRRVEIRKAPQ